MIKPKKDNSAKLILYGKANMSGSRIHRRKFRSLYYRSLIYDKILLSFTEIVTKCYEKLDYQIVLSGFFIYSKRGTS
jgi:hypothetical protein